ncbi:anti sigma factor C-terminal domain-containing protein [Sedimentibacter sp.]|uniref:anti sigma factor C-terminal domain-containing protein n=1 Tax=Sedimentibacter sp. TaxID=1960295 RepID=UPI0028A2B514|nr:anti sigma factor C-terminal domain-containing protein [Sedimentibacter sp.]
MKYKELLERYKNGLASEEEKLIIEQDIEKYEAIEEYLSEIIDDEFTDLTELSELEKSRNETTKLKKSVNKRLNRVVLTSVALMLSLLLIVFFIISPLVDSLYYNPAKLTYGKSTTDIEFDMSAVTELNMPGYDVSAVHVEKQGFGMYEIEYNYINTFSDEYYKVNSKIKRGEIYATHKERYDTNLMFYHILLKNESLQTMDEVMDDWKEDVVNHIKKLNPVSYVSAGISFKDDLTMEELDNLESKYPKVQFVWAGVRTALPGEDVMDMIGIQLLGSNGVHLDDDIEKKYRAFSIMKWLVNPVGSGNSDKTLKAQAYEIHYKSLLQYAIDRKEAVNLIESIPWKAEFYQEAFNYAEKNGVKTYGVLVYAEAEDLIEMIENEQIKFVEFNKALVSRTNI